MINLSIQQKIILVASRIHNRIIYKIIIKEFLKEFNRKYCKRKVFGKYFVVKNNFYVNKQRHELE